MIVCTCNASKLSWRICWELLRGGNVADPPSKTFSCPSRKQWGKTSDFLHRFEGPSGKAVCQKAQLKCLYTNACSMGNKQGEFEIMMCLENYDLVAIMKT